MPSLSWIVLGSIAGVIAGRIVNSSADGNISDILSGSSARSLAGGYFTCSRSHQ
ncbi:hypothetical protein [Metallibacterium sp.]|uniref:hypothetical protein n=1 Tax=Metallibacterium sp. TaxID=2940281 RepID=UPI0026271005|nr:hypothetical protein [Metallibacterium sp.]